MGTSHRNCVLLSRGAVVTVLLLSLVYGGQCLSIGSEYWVCPEGAEPGQLRFPERGGTAVLQIEVSSPKLATSDELKDVPKIPIMAWVLIDRAVGTIRLDLPNPEAIMYILSHVALPSEMPLLVASFYYRIADEQILLAVPSLPYLDDQEQQRWTNATCYDIPVPSQVQNIMQREFFSAFRSRGEENVNSFPTFKWTHSVPLVGSFAYFETCDTRRVPVQLSFQTASALTQLIWSEIDKIESLIPTNWTQTSAKEARTVMNLVNWPTSFDTQAHYPESFLKDQEKGFARDVFEEAVIQEDDDYFTTLDDDEVEESVSPSPSPSMTPSPQPSSTTTSTETSTPSSIPSPSVSSTPSRSTDTSPSPQVSESAGVTESSTPSPYPPRSPWSWFSRSNTPTRTPTREGSAQPSPSKSSSVQPNQVDLSPPGEDLFVARIIFIDWVSGPTDPILYVPPLYCQSGRARPLPSVTLPPPTN